MWKTEKARPIVQGKQRTFCGRQLNSMTGHAHEQPVQLWGRRGQLPNDQTHTDRHDRQVRSGRQAERLTQTIAQQTPARAAEVEKKLLEARSSSKQKNAFRVAQTDSNTR
jgi:hypothetical protein